KEKMMIGWLLLMCIAVAPLLGAETEEIDEACRDAIIGELAALMVHTEGLATRPGDASLHAGLNEVIDRKQKEAAEKLGLEPSELEKEVAARVTKMDATTATGILIGTGVVRVGGALSQSEYELAVKALEYCKKEVLRVVPAAFAAVKAGKIDLVRGFIVLARKGSLVRQVLPAEFVTYNLDFNLETTNKKGENLLAVAIGANQEEIASLLIEEGLRVEMNVALASETGTLAQILLERGQQTELSVLLKSKQESLALTLIERGCELTVKDLFLALSEKKLAAVNAILQAQPGLITEPLESRLFGHEVIRQAIEGTAALLPIIAKQMPLQTIEKYSEDTLASAAVKSGWVGAYQWLLENGFDPMTPNGLGDVPLVTVIKWGRAEFLGPTLLSMPEAEGETSPGISYYEFARLTWANPDRCENRTLVAAPAPESGKETPYNTAYRQITNVLQRNWN
ncbi:MAG: hypothetical protein KDD39_13505, partial [Bdellovibrionales bacterium]|nr:hypothetical protein [Bdellovibrionales bacterium]